MKEFNAIIGNLIFIYHTIVASERLLIEAAEEAGDTELGSYYRTHLEEERSHAQWLADDLLHVGINVIDYVHHPVAVAMAGSQYYLIKHVHPAALLGYMSVLESNQIPVEELEKLEAAYGRSVFRTVRHHAENDPEHIVGVNEMIKKCDAQAEIILMSEKLTRGYLELFSKELFKE